MWKVIITSWIGVIIFSTVSCNVARYDGNSTTSTDSIKTEFIGKTLDSFRGTVRNSRRGALGRAQNYAPIFRLNSKRETVSTTNEVTEIPEMARCITTLQTIKFKPDKDPDPSYEYRPPCTRVQTCSGCCPDEKYSCVATETKIRKFQIHKVFTDRIEDEVKSVEEHVNCACVPTLSENNCHANQEFDERTKRCFCKNMEEKRNCPNDDRRYFDYGTCSCVCGSDVLRDCNTPMIFNEKTCRCE